VLNKVPVTKGRKMDASSWGSHNKR
jgi:hypothetical protein